MRRHSRDDTFLFRSYCCWSPLLSFDADFFLMTPAMAPSRRCAASPDATARLHGGITIESKTCMSFQRRRADLYDASNIMPCLFREKTSPRVAIDFLIS